ncbi:hypothetical protein [Rhizobium sp. BG4]|uniref:hypothetical protein n=1 Tax=Rhizobium sp. BG4 TaxID=2613770 RepID=UPI00193D891C|nr:hypothetical protein [Rhizobium sp. BG4]QRM44017.1 hypothetical protein F2982_11480 [Rhizobium sp. BG4]
MTATAVVKQSDLKRMAAVANEQNVCVEIEIDGRIVRVLPAAAAKQQERNPFAPKGGIDL